MSDLKFNLEQMEEIDKIDEEHKKLFSQIKDNDSIKPDWIYSLKVGDKVCYKQRMKFSVEMEDIIAEVSEIINDGNTVARLNNGVPIDIHGNAIIIECFGVHKAPVQLYTEY